MGVAGKSLSTPGAIIKLLRWHKPSGRLILMIPALWAVFFASEGIPPWALIGLIIGGSLATSAAGCVINDLWDRDIDPHVQRTRQRPLASRRLSVGVGIGVLMISLLCAGGIALFLNPLSFGLAVAALPVILCYPLAKRFFPIPQLVLSLAWGFAVLIAWTAVTARLELGTWLLWAAVVAWTMAFDTIYAMADRPDDRRLGIQSSALFFGERVALAIASFYGLTLVFLAATGWIQGQGFGFALALAISGYAWLKQSLTLRSPHLPATIYGQYFRENVWLGCLIGVGIAVPV
ncbi:4-hydroxybenzoate solanesyltransferase [Candidatus Synechococcus calcipolaris G9]|uniref:4-hydroxybenzoate solanesyltransferase n=1 Tax=Candidatus Synechococcus calcipolaris G9 TaxID=1497997 RepID=A0ABT6EVH0_9SYNE|nr:4-hydroxybenzoate solanesyltransferase [Candidatus Synechococcus calcipolaris]MDG2989758.1 4-hydroxybenzoate solanesyltransferase [Candidatus Synechococcus calcipolaris G9]